MTNVTPVTDTKNGEVIDVFFDITVVIDKQNNAQIIDNKQHDYKDVVDCNTLVVKKFRISV